MNDTLFKILDSRLVVILRGIEGEDAINVVKVLNSSGINVIEVAIHSFQSIETLALIHKEFGQEITLGAGTILNIETAKKAIDAGATFLLSPGFDPEVLLFSHSKGILFIPGAYTPSEIMAAQSSGAKLIKFFPAGGQESYYKNLQGPLAHVPLMPVGNVDLDNIFAFHEMGAKAFGIGSALVKGGTVWDNDALEALKLNASHYVNLLATFKD